MPIDIFLIFCHDILAFGQVVQIFSGVQLQDKRIILG
jgi:hypothetical protein